MTTTVGAYEVGEMLGAVSFGQLYRGVHRVTGHHRSIVRLAPGLGNDAAFVGRLRQEALHPYRHAFVVEVFDVIVDGTDTYVVLGSVDGPSLREQFDRGSAPSLQTALELLQRLATVLDDAHRRGMSGWAISSQNLRLSGSEYVLVDAGVVRAADADTVSAVLDPAYGEPARSLDPANADLRRVALLARELLLALQMHGGVSPPHGQLDPVAFGRALQVIQQQIGPDQHGWFDSARELLASLTAALGVQDQGPYGAPAAPIPEGPPAAPSQPGNRPLPRPPRWPSAPAPVVSASTTSAVSTTLPQTRPPSWPGVTPAPMPVTVHGPVLRPPSAPPIPVLQERTVRLAAPPTALVPVRDTGGTRAGAAIWVAAVMGLLAGVIVTLAAVWLLIRVSGTNSASVSATPPAPTTAPAQPADAPQAPRAAGTGPGSSLSAPPETDQERMVREAPQKIQAVKDLLGPPNQDAEAALKALAELEQKLPANSEHRQTVKDLKYRAYAEDAQRRLEIAIVNNDLGVLAESKDRFGKALETRPGDPAALTGQDNVQLAEWRISYEKLYTTQRSSIDDRIDLLRKIREKRPDYDGAQWSVKDKLYAELIAKAKLFRDQGNDEDAKATLGEAEDVNPNGREAPELTAQWYPTPVPTPVPVIVAPPVSRPTGGGAPPATTPSSGGGGPVPKPSTGGGTSPGSGNPTCPPICNTGSGTSRPDRRQ